MPSNLHERDVHVLAHTLHVLRLPGGTLPLQLQWLQLSSHPVPATNGTALASKFSVQPAPAAACSASAALASCTSASNLVYHIGQSRPVSTRGLMDPALRRQRRVCC